MKWSACLTYQSSSNKKRLCSCSTPSWPSLWRCRVESAGRRRKLLLLLKGAVLDQRKSKTTITREVCVNWGNSPTICVRVCVCVCERVNEYLKCFLPLCKVESFLRNSLPVGGSGFLCVYTSDTHNLTSTGCECGHRFNIINAEEVHLSATICTSDDAFLELARITRHQSSTKT